jgi:hypothetical protein
MEMLVRLQEALFGKGATKGEVLLSLVSGLIGVAVAALCARFGDLDLTWWQWLLLSILAFDIVGGIPANSTDAAVRQHHRAGRPLAPLLFTFGHIHPFLVWLLMSDYSLAAATTLWMSACAGVLLVTVSLAPLKRPVSLICVALGVSVQQLWFPAVGWEWFAPAFLLKLVAGHAVPASVQQADTRHSGSKSLGRGAV